MSNKTKRHIWPVALMPLVVAGVLAVVVALSGASPQPAQAHECEDLPGSERARCESLHTRDGVDHDADGNGGGNGNGNVTPAGSNIKADTDTSGAAVELTLVINTTDLNTQVTGTQMAPGDRIEIFLEDDYSVPGTIDSGSVYFRIVGGTGAATNNGGATMPAEVSVDDGGEQGDDEDMHTIAVEIPDFNPRDDEFGYPPVARDLQLVIRSSAGIKNPSEEGNHAVGFSVLTGIETADGTSEFDLGDLQTFAKVAISADDGGRGASLKITGSGFNDGTNASVEVLQGAAGVNDDADNANDISCEAVLAAGISLGSTAVRDNDTFELDITVHQDQFKAGAVNYICAKDNEAPTNRFAQEPKVFELTKSLTVSPGSVSSGDEVTIKPRDFPGSLSMVNLGGSKNWYSAANIADHLADYSEANAGDLSDYVALTNDFDVDPDGSDFVFDMPGGLSGTVQIAVTYVENGADNTYGSDDDVSTPKNVSITVNSAGLSLSSTEVAPNATVIISGSGFNDNSCVKTSDITIKDIVSKRLVVDSAGVQTGECTKGDYIQTTSSGEFTATISIWTHDSVDNNPALDDGDYKIEAKDIHGFKGSATVTILEPTVSVMPEMVSPRDFITISGENWPISTADADHEVKIMVDGRNRSVNIDGNGRFRYQYQLRSSIGIGDEHEVVVEFTSDGGSIEEEATFEVHDAGIMLTPTEAAPGQTISVEIEGMPPYALVDHVNIDGVNRLGSQNLNTDRHGNVMITGVLVPYLDPGFYPVQVTVGGETRVVQLEVLSEAVVAGVAAALPGAVEDLGDSVARIFHFNTTSKVWTFYDPRPEFEGLNTLTELAAGQPYWILVSENVENVVLNGRTRNLTCVGGDCWNQLVW